MYVGAPMPRGLSRREFTIDPGLQVYSSDGVLLGLEERIFLEAGVVTGFLVSHGPAYCQQKYFRLDVVDHLTENAVVLKIDETSFTRHPDISFLRWM
jgi:hypothetical protein